MDTPHCHDGADPSGNLICPACAQPRTAGHYLCRSCWFALPAPARAALSRRDRHALTRLRQLIDQLGKGQPPAAIEVTP
ncbi:hypothetical protein QA802_30745 [Streptomyces sp. B21-105]|uniref:hypothetical protein n=1 Tax=Streptomyces sp. B21-105 TaxID=3039417 RepID=UPI002FF122C9